jgi:hypothetical protein
MSDVIRESLPSNLAGLSDRALEDAAMASVAVIERLVAERATFRNHANYQNREMMALRVMNDELRRRVNLIRDHYLELGSQILKQLEQFDQEYREALHKAEREQRCQSDGDRAAFPTGVI